MRVLNQIHQGGENEAPSNTLFAYHDGLAKGGDMIELDVHATKDRQLVAIHDDTVDRTTNGSGRVAAMTLAQVRRLDAAHWFVPGHNAVRGRPAADYPYRGVRTGRKAAPAGFEADDFRIPTLAEVFSAFPDVPINIEIKGKTQDEKLRVADLLAAYLKKAGRSDVLVASFDQVAVDRFHQKAPKIDVAPGVDGISGFLLGGQPAPRGTKALQIPIRYSFGPVTLDVVTREHVEKARRAGYAVHVWLDKSEENDEVYGMLADLCVDGVMTAEPTRYEAFLERRGLPRTGGQGGAPGSDGCAKPKAPPRGCRVRASKVVEPRGGRIAVRLQRYGDLRGACSVKVALTGRAAGRGARGKPVRLASGSVRVPAGRIASFGRLKLSKRGAALVRSSRRGVTVRAVVKASRTDTRTFALAGR
nr:glycerophosphodiester phosphodiesterase [Conexibacter arvalis]